MRKIFVPPTEVSMRSLCKLIWQCVTMWRVPATSLEGAQAILCHAAGENSPDDPGSVNRYLASLVTDLYKNLQVPVFVQGEVAPCLSEIPVYASARQAEVAPHYINTYDLTRWFRGECEKIRATRVVVVSYYPHYWRAVRAAQSLGFTVLVPEGIEEMYDAHNSQWWARFKWRNRLYEALLARPGSLLKGWL
jgi:hypothetical protein